MPLALAHVSRLRVDHSWADLLHMPDSHWPLTTWPSTNEHIWVTAPLPVGIPEEQTHEAELKPSHSLCPLQLVCTLSHRWPNEASRDQPSHSQHHRRLSVKINVVVCPRILSEYTSLLWWKLTNIPSYLENGPFLVCPYWRRAPEKSLTPWMDRSTEWWHVTKRVCSCHQREEPQDFSVFSFLIP